MNMINQHHQQLNNNNNNDNNNNNNLRTIGDVEGNIVSGNNDNYNNDNDGDRSNEDSMLPSTINMSPTHVYSAYHEDNSNVGTSRDFFIGK